MRAGRLRHRLKVLRKVSSVTPGGAHKDDFNLVASQWGSVEGIRGREYFEAGANRGEVDVRIRMRMPADVRVSDRIEFTGIGGKRLFDVQSPPVDVMGRGREAEIMAKEYVA